MLRVGLTGELGSGKSTVARMLVELGAVVLSSDEMGRALMEPGEPAYRAIVEAFGPGVVEASGRLNRGALARIAFDPERPRIAELNALIHPAVLRAQEEKIRHIAETSPRAIVIVESALIFSVTTGQGEAQVGEAQQAAPWRSRFDCVVVVTAPRAVKIARFVERMSAGRELAEAERQALESDAARRLDTQEKTPAPTDESVIRLSNDRSEAELREHVQSLWHALVEREAAKAAG